MNNGNKYFCIFGGGAIRGLAYVGAVRAMREQNVEITGYAGSSAGSIAAVTAALGYDEKDMAEIFDKFDYMLFRDINFSFKIELAISKGEVFTDRIREIISKKLGTEEPVTFNDFPNDLYILASNITTGKCVIFSKETTPDFEVAQAVRISAGFPGLMDPVEIDGEYYVDGDLAKPYAISQISPLLNPRNTRVLEFRLEGAKIKNPPTNPFVLLNYGVDFISNASTDRVLRTYKDKDKYDFVVIETKNIMLFDFNLPKEKKDYLVNLGYETTKKFFEVTLPQKNQKLIKEYSLMKEKIDKVHKYISERNYKKAKDEINTYMAMNHSSFAQLDENVILLADKIAASINLGQTQRLFFIPTLKNHTQIKNDLNKLSLRLENKISNFIT